MLLRMIIDCFVIVSREPFGALTSASLSAMHEVDMSTAAVADESIVSR